MSLPRKLFVGAGIVFGCVLAALLVLPLLFKDRIAARARAALDGAVDAQVAWGDLGLSFFRDFPNLTLGLDDLTVVGHAPFEGDTLAAIGSFRFVLDVGSVWRAWRSDGPVLVRSVRLVDPDLRLHMLEDGTANWDVLDTGEGAEPADTAAPRAMRVVLQSFTVTGGSVLLRNERSDLFASLRGLRHTLTGDLSRDNVVVRTRTHADGATVRFAGTPWLSGATLDFDADLDADLAAKRFAFADNELRLNDLVVRFSGDVAQGDSALAMHVAFAAPRTEFGQILSLVPAVYARDFSSLRTSGTFSLQGQVDGAYGARAFPSFALTATIDDGTFQYPDLPLPARAISADLSVGNPGGDVDSTVVELRRFHIEIGDQPIDAAVSLRTPISDPDIDGTVRGTLDLGAVQRTIKLEGVDELAGIVTADAAVRARLSDLDSARYERVAARGSVTARDVTLRSPDLRQPVAVQEATITLSPRRAELQSFQALLGSSDVRATGSIDNLLGYVLRDDPLRGNATFASRRFVLDEWRSEDPDLKAIPVPATLDLTLDATVDTLTFGDLVMTGARGAVRMADQRLTLDDFTLNTLGGRVGMNGWYETLDPANPTFEFGLGLDSLDVSKAAKTVLTVRTLAPVARYAKGSFSADMDLRGTLDRDLKPVFDVLDGGGSLLTSRIAIEGFPLLERLADVVKIPRLSSPTFDAIRSSVEIRGGRMFVKPFRVGVGDFRMMVEGSNGIDQSLDYTLGLTLPRGILGDATHKVVEGLAARAGQAGLNLTGVDSVRLGVRVRGTVSDPSIELGLGEAVASLRDRATEAAGAAVEQRIDDAKERVDSAAAEARRRAQERADSIVAEAERRAEAIRTEARRLAEEAKADAKRRADEQVAKATNPIAKRAAQAVADRILKEANEKADASVAEADARADALVAEARRRADELVKGAGSG